MVQLNLTKEEYEVLTLLLTEHLADLSYEIADTDRVEFRNQLKAKREVLNKIMNELKKSKT